MARTSFLLDTGPAGADLTAANTGGSTPVKDTGGSAKFTDVTPYQGSFSGRYFYQASQGTGTFNRYTSPTANPRFTTFAFRYTDISTYAIMPVMLRSSSTAIANIRVTNVSGSQRLTINASASSATEIATLLTDTDPGTWYRILIEISNYTTGAYTISVFDNLSTTPLNTVTGTNAAFAGISYSVLQIGQGAVLPVDVTVDADYVVFDDTTSIGVPSNTPPTVTLSAAQNVAAGSSVNVSATATDPDGSIASYAWTVDYCSTTSPTLTGASTSAVSLVAPAAGNLVVLKCVVTDNNGAATTAFTEVRVTKAGTLTVLPDDAGKGYTVVNGTYTVFGSSPNMSAALRDADATTGARSATVTSTPAEARYRLEPGGTRSSIDVTLGGVDKDDAGALTASMKVYNGGTLIGTYPVGTITTTPTDKTIAVDLTGAGMNANNVWIALVATS